MAEKKEDFVVSDRRRFVSEGESREETAREEETTAAPQAVATPEVPPAAEEEMPAPPTELEQRTQQAEYQASGKKIDEMIHQAGGGHAPAEMSFEKLIESFYMTALIQMGAVRPEGETPRVDIIGARQTIDSLSILNEKTKGNLTDREQTLLQNVLFELRMAWIEITNAIAHAQPAQPGAGPVTGKK